MPRPAFPPARRSVVEVLTLLLSPQGPVKTPFFSAYENLRRVLEPGFEALPQAVTQLSFLLYGFFFQGKGFDDFLLLASLAASIAQLYHTFHYVDGLSRAYRVPRRSIILELLSLGSDRFVPFRLVLRSWQTVDFRAVRYPADLSIAWLKQVADALSGNESLRRVLFAKRQLNAEGMAELCAALKVNRHCRELGVFDDATDEKRKGCKELVEQIQQMPYAHRREEPERTRLLLYGHIMEASLPRPLIDVLGARTGLRRVRLEGYSPTHTQYAPLFPAIATSRNLEQFHLVGALHSEPQQTLQTRLALPAAHKLAAVRSLQQLSLRRADSEGAPILHCSPAFAPAMAGGLYIHTPSRVCSACSALAWRAWQVELDHLPRPISQRPPARRLQWPCDVASP